MQSSFDHPPGLASCIAKYPPVVFVDESDYVRCFLFVRLQHKPTDVFNKQEKLGREFLDLSTQSLVRSRLER